MSPEAKRWIAERLAAPLPPAQTLAETRAALLLEALKAAPEITRRTGVTCQDITIDGIQALEITPKNPNPRRHILYIYGGGFTTGSPIEDLMIAAPLAAQTNATIIAPHYRLAPEYPFPAGLDDVTRVAKALARTHGRFALVGESAGGTLALALTQRLKAVLATPHALGLLSPAADLSDHGDSATTNDGFDPTLTLARMDQVEPLYIAQNDPKNAEISPIYGDFDADFPPTFITSGTRDLLLSQSVRLEKTLREAGAEVTLRIWEGLWHVFEFYPEIPESHASLSEIAGFLNQHFGNL